MTYANLVIVNPRNAFSASWELETIHSTEDVFRHNCNVCQKVPHPAREIAHLLVPDPSLYLIQKSLLTVVPRGSLYHARCPYGIYACIGDAPSPCARLMFHRRRVLATTVAIPKVLFHYGVHVDEAGSGA